MLGFTQRKFSVPPEKEVDCDNERLEPVEAGLKHVATLLKKVEVRMRDVKFDIVLHCVDGEIVCTMESGKMRIYYKRSPDGEPLYNFRIKRPTKLMIQISDATTYA